MKSQEQQKAIGSSAVKDHITNHEGTFLMPDLLELGGCFHLHLWESHLSENMTHERSAV